MAVTQQTILNEYTGNGITLEYPYTFLCIEQSSLRVFIDGVQSVLGTDYVVTDVGIDAGGSIIFNVAPADGTRIIIFRDTIIDRSTDYINGGSITADTLDADQDKQTIILQEIKSRGLFIDGEGKIDAKGFSINNVGTPVSPGDVVNKAYADTILNATQGFANSAANSANNASNSADAAAFSALNAQGSASAASASAIAANDSANAASDSADAASISAGVAENFADDAANAALQAQLAAVPITISGYTDDTGPYGGDCSFEVIETISRINLINPVNLNNTGSDCGYFPRWNYIGPGQADLDSGTQYLAPKFTIAENGTPVTTTYGIGRIDFTGNVNVSADSKASGDGLHTVTVDVQTGAPFYEEFVATAAQTVFNTTMPTTAKAAGKANLQVFVNGVLQQEGATKKFTVTGANQITFNSGLAVDDDVAIYGYV